MKALQKYQYLVAVILLLIGAYLAYDMYQLYQQRLLWGHRLFGFWSCAILAVYFISLRASNRQILSASLLSGVLMWLGFMQDYTFFAMFVAFVPMLWVEAQLEQSKADKPYRLLLKYFFFSFFVWNLLSTWWIQNSSLWAGIFGNALNAFFMCIPWLAYALTKRLMSKRAAYLGIVAYWLSFEIGHLNWSLSWPWLTLGNSFANLPPLVQWYEYTGVFGGSLWILCVNLLFYEALQLYMQQQKADSPLRMQLLKALVWVLVPALFSVVLYMMHAVQTNQEAEVVAVQPNYEPHHQKFNTPQNTQFEQFLRLSTSMLTPQTDYLLFPETSFRQINAEELELARPVQAMQQFVADYPSLNAVMGISASIRYESGDIMPPNVFTYCNDDKSFCQYYDHHNAAIQINNNQQSIPYYKKSKLVPGAESMPFIGNIDFFKGLILDLGGAPGLSLGTQPYRAVFKSKAATAGPLICYESVYGDYVTDYVKAGADLLFVLTNDGWWDNTAGHRQHMYLSSLRAIENRRYVVRSANSGISCFINSRGDIYQQTTYDKATAIRNKVYLHNTTTIYTLYGDLIGRVSLLVTCWILVSMLSQRMRAAKENAT